MARILFLISGWFFTSLGVIGAILPLVPTTPFLIVAVFCFSRSSPGMHARLLRVPLVGIYLRQWDATHTVPRMAKYKAWFVLAFMIGMSIYWIDVLWVRLLLLGIGALVAWVISRLPEREHYDPELG